MCKETACPDLILSQGVPRQTEGLYETLGYPAIGSGYWPGTCWMQSRSICSTLSWKLSVSVLLSAAVHIVGVTWGVSVIWCYLNTEQPSLDSPKLMKLEKLCAMCGVRRGADKSLARTISRCRRTESIVSLQRVVCSCAELQVFSCYTGWKEGCQATRAISTTSRHELSRSFFFLQGKAPNEIRAILTETLGENASSCATVKTGWPSLNVVIFPPVLRLVLDNPKQWPPRRL